MPKQPKPRKGMHGPYADTTKQVNKTRIADAKRSGYQQPMVTKSSDGLKLTSKSISAKKPSVPIKPSSAKAKKAGAMNKMKAQGTKAVSGPTARAMQFKKKGM